MIKVWGMGELGGVLLLPVLLHTKNPLNMLALPVHKIHFLFACVDKIALHRPFCDHNTPYLRPSCLIPKQVSPPPQPSYTSDTSRNPVQAGYHRQKKTLPLNIYLCLTRTPPIVHPYHTYV